MIFGVLTTRETNVKMPKTGNCKSEAAAERSWDTEILGTRIAVRIWNASHSHSVCAVEPFPFQRSFLKLILVHVKQTQRETKAASSFGKQMMKAKRQPGQFVSWRLNLYFSQNNLKRNLLQKKAETHWHSGLGNSVWHQNLAGLCTDLL